MLLILLFCLLGYATAQAQTLQGRVLSAEGRGLAEVIIQCEGQAPVFSDDQGYFSLSRCYPCACSATAAEHEVLYWQQPLGDSLELRLKPLQVELDDLTYEEERSWTAGHLRAIEGTSINAAKKSELILVGKLPGNLATNNPREIYAKVAGLNIWENDNSGLQLNIGARGLSPNRTSNFNTRQNGYDISADALGYPETYYTPPAQALARIELIRGAASLQYGTQFGGLLNFVLREGPKDKALQWRTEQTLGSYGFYSSFNSLGGSLAKRRFNYYAYHQYKKGDGWRPFSEYQQHSGGLSLRWQGEKWRLKAELTKMYYLARQPGGLTDLEFNLDHSQAKRPRNWFKIDWNILALHWDYDFSEQVKLNLRAFGLLARRESLGNLQPINRVDYGGERDLIKGRYQNLGLEGRYLHRYNIKEQPAALLLGFRAYNGQTQQRQGWGNADSTGQRSDFEFLPYPILRNDYRFPSWNLAAFAEHYFNLGKRFTLTPGLRYEYIQTQAQGYYQNLVVAPSANGMDTLLNEAVPEELSQGRSILLAGLGLGYRLGNHSELYANFSQNYRAINFNDLRILNPNQEVDPKLKDERGFNADFGFRGQWRKHLRYDLSLFYLQYQNRIGNLRMQRPDPENPYIIQVYNLRTNIGNARVLGLESVVELHLLKGLLGASKDWEAQVFVNFAYLDGRYTQTENSFTRNKKLELVAPLTLKTGFSLSYKSLRLSYQYNYTQAHYSDATNAESSANAVVGLIPSYQVMDLSLSYEWRSLKLQLGSNNLSNERYFTRRASSYPGPGILPGEARSFYLSLQYVFEP